MAHPTAIIAAKPSVGTGIQNGSLVVMVTEVGSSSVQSRAPDVNSFVDSGVLNTRTSGRFDEHYGGGAS
jgi:hypothetical protein